MRSEENIFVSKIKVWEKLAKQDPMWAVLSHPSKRNKWNQDEFFKIGREDIGLIISELKKINPEQEFKTCLDFGCGLGRLTRPLSEEFEKVLALDGSHTMIQNATKLHKAHSNCIFEVCDPDYLKNIPSNSFNLVISLITIQHIPKTLIPFYLDQLSRIVSKNGVLIFNLPYKPRVSPKLINFIRFLKHLDLEMFEMNYLDQSQVNSIMKENNLELISKQSDNLSKLFKSYRYFYKKIH